MIGVGKEGEKGWRGEEEMRKKIKSGGREGRKWDGDRK